VISEYNAWIDSKAGKYWESTMGAANSRNSEVLFVVEEMVEQVFGSFISHSAEFEREVIHSINQTWEYIHDRTLWREKLAIRE